MEKGSRIGNSIKNMFAGVGNRVIILVLNFVFRTVAINTIGAVYLGLDSTFSNVISVLCMADLGFNMAVVYSFYEPLAHNDTAAISGLITFYKKVYNIMACVIGGIGLAIIPFLKFIINTEETIHGLYFYYILVLANAVAYYLFLYKTSVLTADQKDYIRTTITMVINIIKIVLQIVLLWILKSYTSYLVLNLIATVLGNILTSRRAEKEYPYINEPGTLNKEQKGEIVYTVKSVFFYKLSNVMLNATDNVLISMLVGTIFVGYYGNYYLIYNALVMILTIIFRSTVASVGNLVITEEADTRYRIFDYMQGLCLFMVCVIIPCFFNLVDDFVLGVWIRKEEFLIGLICVLAITISLYLESVFLPVVSYREAVGLYKKSKYYMLGAAIINIALSIILSFPLGMAGILLATPIARTLTYVWYEPRILFKEYFERSSRGFFMNIFKNLILVAALTFVCHLATGFITVTNLIWWIIKALICCVICVAAVLVFYSRTPAFQWAWGLVRGFLGRKNGK